MRGRVDLVINGSYWLGVGGGSLAALAPAQHGIFAADLGWRFAFGVGAVLGLLVLLVRRNVPESPRWLFIHGQEEEAERIVGEHRGARSARRPSEELNEPEDEHHGASAEGDPVPGDRQGRVHELPERAFLGLALFVGQAFIYNGVTFNLGTLLNGFFGVASGMVPFFIAIWALSQLPRAGDPGRLFDTVGRKPMISRHLPRLGRRRRSSSPRCSCPAR